MASECKISRACDLLPGFWDFPYTPVIPQFYWDVNSGEQRIKYLCQLFDKLTHYVDSMANEINANATDIAELKEQFEKFMESGFDDYYAEQIEQWVKNNMERIISCAVKMVFFGLTDDGYFCAYIPKSWDGIVFDTGAVYGTEQYGRLILRYRTDGCGAIDNTAPGYPGCTAEDLEKLKKQIAEIRHTLYTALTKEG